MTSNQKIVRQSLIEWYPFDKNDEVVLINGGDSFLDELIKSRSRLTIIDEYKSLLSCLEDGNKFDVVIMYDLYDACIRWNVGINELVKSLIDIKQLNGTLFIAMENKLGMKYWAGCQEEHFGGYYVGIEDYSSWSDKVHPLSKKEIEDIFDGFDVDYKFYYPYPDYKYPTMLFTDECLPKEGELFRNIRNIDRDRYVMFDEKKAFDSVIKAGLFPEFSNSYLMLIK